MAWRDLLLDAALDGVPFLYEEVTNEFGRRGEVHEFPGRDEPFAEDLGRAARRYAARAFILGENYTDGRDALRDVLEAGGNHVFTHPYQGDKIVKLIGTARLTESDKEGGMARFDFTLVEAGVSVEVVLISTDATVKTLAADALEALSEHTKFSLLGAIGDVLSSVSNGINTASSAVRKVNGKIGGALGGIDNISNAIDAFEAELTTLLNTPTALMNKLGALVDSVLALVSVFEPDANKLGVRVEPVDLVLVTREATADLFGFSTEATAIPTPTTQSVLEHAAHEAVTIQMQGAALASGAAALADLQLESADQAQAILEELAEMFEAVLSANVDPEVYEAFAALKAATVGHFTEIAQTLPQVTSYTPPATVPALVLAYELYADPDLDDDLIRRNKIRHPAFVQGGRALEVLADA